MIYVRDEIEKALEIVKTTTIDEKFLAETKSHLKYSFAIKKKWGDSHWSRRTTNRKKDYEVNKFNYRRFFKESK